MIFLYKKICSKFFFFLPTDPKLFRKQDIYFFLALTKTVFSAESISCPWKSGQGDQNLTSSSFCHNDTTMQLW